RVAVVAVGDDADAHPRDLLHQPGHGRLELPPDLRETRVHAAGGVEAEDDLDGVVDHWMDPCHWRDARWGAPREVGCSFSVTSRTLPTDPRVYKGRQRLARTLYVHLRT